MLRRVAATRDRRFERHLISAVEAGRIGLVDLVSENAAEEARHFRISDDMASMAGAQGAHPPYDLWVTADEHAIFVQGGVGGYMQTWYELVALQKSAAA